MSEPFGMYNSGVICYFNSAMQALMSSKHFINFLSQSDCPLSKEIISHMKSRDSYNLNVFNAFLAKSTCKSFGFCQEDAGEFIILLMDCFKDNPFMYEYKCNIFCMKCRKNKQIASDKNVFFYTTPASMRDNALEGSGVQNYIQNNFSKCYGMECSYCKDRRIVKTNRLVSISEIILISIQPDSNKKEKCEYPSYLRFKSGNDLNVYRLISVIYHIGTKESGHYYAKCLRGEKWYKVNDLDITPSEYPFPEENAYILLYDYVNTEIDGALT